MVLGNLVHFLLYRQRVKIEIVNDAKLVDYKVSRLIEVASLHQKHFKKAKKDLVARIYNLF